MLYYLNEFATERKGLILIYIQNNLKLWISRTLFYCAISFMHII
jgi:hypothetical protein